MFERILVPLDGSPQAEGILPRVEASASASMSKVYLLRVIDQAVSSLDSEGTGTTVLTAEREQYEREAEQYLVRRRSALRNLKIDSEGC